MTTAKRNPPVTVNEYVKGDNTGEDVEANFNTFSNVENDLLSQLIWCPARLILDVASGLEEDDFFNEHARIIYRAILAEAHGLDTQGHGDHDINPMFVLNALRATRNYDEPIHRLLCSITATNTPAPIAPIVRRLAQYLREERLRRGLDTAGRELLAASQRSHEHIRVALDRIQQHLPALARRAGLELETGDHA